MDVFEVIDKSGRKIRMTKERWNHITSPQSLHTYMSNYLEEVRETATNPDVIVPNKFDESKVNCYKYIKERKEYLLVVIKYLNGDGYILTSFMTRSIRRR